MPKLLYLALFHRRLGSSETSTNNNNNNNSKSDSAYASIRLYDIVDVEKVTFFARNTVRESLKFAARTAANRINDNERVSIRYEQDDKTQVPFLIHSFCSSENNICGILITDFEYERRVAFVCIQTAIKKYLEENSLTKIQSLPSTDVKNPICPTLDALFRQYANPKDADLLSKIQVQVNQVHQLADENMKQILKNGETVEQLVAMSDDLDKQSKLFLKQSKKANSCCNKIF